MLLEHPDRASSACKPQWRRQSSAQRITPLGGAPLANGTRSVLIKGFPFSLVYRASDVELLVVAVAPHRRLPDYWLPRIA